MKVKQILSIEKCVPFPATALFFVPPDVVKVTLSNPENPLKRKYEAVNTWKVNVLVAITVLDLYPTTVNCKSSHHAAAITSE